MTSQDIESESSVDEQTVEFTDTTNNHRLEQGKEEKAVGVWIFDDFPSLFRTPLGTFDTLRVPSYSLDKLGLGLVVCPPDFGWGVGQEEESGSWTSVIVARSNSYHLLEEMNDPTASAKMTHCQPFKPEASGTW